MPRIYNKAKSTGWHLYWVFSDGLEDCFVVARNIRSAIKVEREMNGFDINEVGAHHVCRIPEAVAEPLLSKYKKKKIEWPWYGWADLLKKLGAEYREIDGRQETLIDGTVYSGGYVPRVIGARFLREFTKNKTLASFGEEDHYSDRQNILFTLLGICIARCQEIEHYIAHSFILGVSMKNKNKYTTINDLISAWKRKTLGQLIVAIEEWYELESEFKTGLEWFLSKRNQLVHGLTTHPQYDIQTDWGQDEMVAFLSQFEFVSRAVRQAFRGCYFASMDYGNSYLLELSKPRVRFTRKQKNEISLFAHFFKLREAD